MLLTASLLGACGPLFAGWAVSVGGGRRPPHTYSRSIGVRSLNGSPNSLATVTLPSILTDSMKRPHHRAAITHRGNESLDLLKNTNTD
uniref:Putative secreted protein n=1 Tax=Ixodes ricinus TaxID=34613 RepID=A0A6B0UC12_IXORI